MTSHLDDIDTEGFKARFSTIETALTKAPAALPSISPVPSPAKGSERRSKSLSLPDYVWDQLRERAFTTRDTQNVVVMRALKMMGFAIHDEDLVDQRGGAKT